MEPKFQSSFIPKGPLATVGAQSRISRESDRSLLGTLAVFVFGLSVILALGIFGYEQLLKNKIKNMGESLSSARSTLDPETINKIYALDIRLTSAKDLLDKHIVITPLFSYLQEETLDTVRFTQFQYSDKEDGKLLVLKGQARGYSSVALQAKLFSEGNTFVDPTFTDLDLDDKGNVTFTFRAGVNPKAVSYKNLVGEGGIVSSMEGAPLLQSTNINGPVSSTTSTSTQPNPAIR